MTERSHKLIYISVLLIIWLVVILFVDPSSSIGLDDSPRYGFVVKNIVEKGDYDLVIPFAPNLLLQALWGSLFCMFTGFSYTTLTISVLTISILFTIISFNFLISIKKDYFLTFVIILLWMFNPLFFCMSFTFMTDVPFACLSLFSIYFFYLFYQSEKPKFLYWAFTFSALSFLIRQPGIIPPVFFGILYLVQKKGKDNSVRYLIIALLTGFILWFGFELFKSITGTTGKYISVTKDYVSILGNDYQYFIGSLVKQLYKIIIYIGIFTIPIITLFFKPAIGLFNKRKYIHAVMIFVNIIILYFMYRSQKIFPFSGSVIYNTGLGCMHLKDVHLYNINISQLPYSFFIVLNFLGQIIGTYFLMYIGNSIYKTKNPFQIFLFLLGFIYMISMSITSFFDRYLIFTIFSLFLLFFLIHGKKIISKRSKFVILSLSLLFIWFSTCATADYLRWNRARDNAYAWLMNENISPGKIDGGREANSMYNYDSPEGSENPDKAWWWVTDDEYAITMGDLPGYTKIKSYPFYRTLHLQQDSLYIIKRIH